MKTILVTGCAGFIGSYISKELLNNNYQVIGIDNINDYYDISLKEDRLKNLKGNKNFVFIKEDICSEDAINNIFIKYKPEIVLHLAGYAGVRYSYDNPDIYIKNNILGFYNILKLSKKNNIKHFIFASSSSVYGNTVKVPFKEDEADLSTESIYASTKLCDEIISNSFSKLFDIPITALRFFSVYGPLGRPDMAYYSFTQKLIKNEEIYLYNNGELKRDFTYITDVVDGIYKVVSNEPKDIYNVYNIGGNKQYTVNELVDIIIQELIKNNLVDKSIDFSKLIKYSDVKKGEVNETYADITKIKNDFNYNPKVSLKDGIKEFIKWYKDYYSK